MASDSLNPNSGNLPPKPNPGNLPPKPNTGALPPKPEIPSRRNRRERRRARRSSPNGTPVASGSSTPLGKLEDDSRGANGPKPTENGTPLTSKDAPNRNSKPETKTPSFEEGEEFIPFEFSDSSGNEAGPSTNRKERKGKAKEVEVAIADAPDDTGKATDEPNAAASSQSERTREKSRARESEREWDRGKQRMDRLDDERDSRRNGSHKRKYKDFDPDDGYANKKERMDAASRKCPWVQNLDLERCQNVAEMLHKEVDAFVNWISPSAVEDEVRGLVVAHITRVVTSAFSDAVVYPFGSFQTKLYLPLGDIDLVVLSDTMAYSDKSTVLHLLANILKRGGITSHVTIIAKAKVPIVKFVTTHGRFKVDISINHANGLVSGQIITGFLKNMIPSANGKESKALRSLVMITKAFLSQRSMNEVYTGGLGSYSIVCLAVSFLQMHPKIRRGEIDPEENLGVLAMEFFELYGYHFNYDEVGISLRDGGMYFSKRQRGWHAEYKRNMLSIEDPADSSNDISSGSYNFHKVRTAFAGCHGILTSTAYLRAGILSSRRHGHSVSIRNHYEPEDLSILSTVMGITQETINHRRLVQELYERRTLHNIVGVQPLPVYVSSHEDNNNGRKEDRIASSSKSNSSRAALESIYERSWDYEEEYNDHRDQRHHRDGDDERGRYDIGRQPPKKRRRTGRPDEEARTVYIPDDDEDDEEQRRYDEMEDREYWTDGGGDFKRNGNNGGESSNKSRSRGSKRDDRRDDRRDDKRSYWLSKASPAMADPADDSY